ncbi:hypothetical protein LINPERHAP2_LOCUS39346 [Linum perenne]
MGNFFISAIYGKPSISEREGLWRDIRRIASNMEDPWTLVGDFNVMLSLEDKRGGAELRSRQNLPFIQCCNDCGLSNTSFYGPKFTWFRGMTVERLDRALLNDAWKLRFPFSKVRHLGRLYSDHRPILLHCEDIQRSRLVRPFRFLVPWLGHDSFKQCLQQSWGEQASLPAKLLHLSTKLKKWNKEVFGTLLLSLKRRKCARQVALPKGCWTRKIAFAWSWKKLCGRRNLFGFKKLERRASLMVTETLRSITNSPCAGVRLTESPGSRVMMECGSKRMRA